MTPQRAKELSPIITAFIAGEYIEYRYRSDAGVTSVWSRHSVDELHVDPHYEYRIKPTPDAALKSIGDYKREMALAHGTGPQPNGLACPLCGKELMDTSPSVRLLSHPPLKTVKCFDCGWTGTV